MSTLHIYLASISNFIFPLYFLDIFLYSEIMEDIFDERVIDNPFWLRINLYAKIGRSSINVVRENYLQLFSISTHPRLEQNVYETPLHVAAVEDADLFAVRDLLNSPFTDKNAVNRYGETTLLLAVKEKVSDEIIHELLLNDCNPNINDARGVTPLHIVTFDNKIDLMTHIIQRGGNVNAETNMGITPLHLAVLASHFEAVQELLGNNANPLLNTHLHYTPLMLSLAYRDIDIRICQLLCSYDIHAATPIGNPLYCATRARHHLAEYLLNNGADVNYIGNMQGVKTSCLVEAISLNNKRLFDLMWTKFNKNIFENEFSEFLEYFADRCGLKGNDLVDCIIEIFQCRNGPVLHMYFRDHRDISFLEALFEKADYYKLTRNNRCNIISAVPVVFYEDVLYVYKKYGFDRELEIILKHYEFDDPGEDNNTLMDGANAYVDLLCYNVLRPNVYNLRDIAQLLKFCTPNMAIRTQFYSVFSALANLRDPQLERLIALYKVCDAMYASRPVASLQEIARDKVRYIIFSQNLSPYLCISELPLPDIIKDILYLKMPLY